MKFNGNFTGAMKDYAEEKLERLAKYTDVKKAVVTYKVLGEDSIKVEISLGDYVRASKMGRDYYALIIHVVEQLDGQIRRYRTSQIFNKRKAGILEFEYDGDEADDNLIEKEKILIADSLSQDEAVEEMELLGHNFFIYRDIDRMENFCVVYKRADGSYGLIECK